MLLDTTQKAAELNNMSLVRLFVNVRPLIWCRFPEMTIPYFAS
jgi:hypothetical protein